MEISLTDFVEFVSKSGVPRLTHVRNIKARPAYSPKMDYWKGFREALAQFHEAGGTDTGILLAAVQRHKTSHVNSQYDIRLKSYERFLGRRTTEWLEPVRAEWVHDALTVKVNPELHLIMGGRAHVVKLYLREEPLPKKNSDLISFMMRLSLLERCCPGTAFCVLDVPRNKLSVCPEPPPALLPLLKGEAAAFAEIWESLDE